MPKSFSPRRFLIFLKNSADMLKDEWKFYSKFQIMSSYGPNHHNRSYQHFSHGIGHKKYNTQFGVKLNVDEYEGEAKTSRNWGVFVRHEFH